jgi:diaminohydroxyphosphoribosylaminopyrimidine deaminase/5-amino-6-(5-phosphoribosylamino)uracil reductase
MQSSSIDRHFMERALQLARHGVGCVSPNPLVGCVIVGENGEAIGEGAHRAFGGPHAEPNAIRDAESRGYSVEKATMYVTLEPHSFMGKTPPCTELIIAKNIARCVIAMEDPNPNVAGEGIRQLQQAGIKTEVGCMEQEARELNRFYMKHVRTGLPYVTLKLAMSMDGRSALASGESHWITSESSRRRVHAMRAEHDAVMIGMRTALLDNPQLTVRFDEVARQPWRIVLDPFGELPESLNIFTDEQRDRTIRVRITGRNNQQANGNIEVGGVGDELNLLELFTALGNRNIASVLVEAGPTLAASIVKKRLFDELVIFQAPILLGGDARPAIAGLSIESLMSAVRLRLHSFSRVEPSEDIEIHLRPGGTEAP